MTQDNIPAAGATPQLEDEFHRIRDGFGEVPNLEQFEALKLLAGRLEVVIKPSEREAACIDMVTGSNIEPTLAKELLGLTDAARWQLDAAQLHQAEIVASIGNHADWRGLTIVQRRALAAWRLQHPDLTYGNILHLGPQAARARLELHYGLQQHVQPGVAAVAIGDPPVIPEATKELVEGPVEELSEKSEESAIEIEASLPTVTVIDPERSHLPAGIYAAIESIDPAIQQAIIADALHPPAGVSGFIRIDPYGTTNTIKEAVNNYLDKMGQPLPVGSKLHIADMVASYNGLSPVQELVVGQIIWFPGRDVLVEWANRTA